MGMIVTDDKHYKNIASTIREITGSEETYTSEEMTKGVNEVYEAGKKSEYDKFWDSCQDNGKRWNYEMAFAGQNWKPDNFKPKYPMKPRNAVKMFYKSSCLTCDITEVADIDFSDVPSLLQTFQNFMGTRIGVLDIRKASDITNMVANCSNLVTIDKIIVDESLPGALSFSNDSKLENVIIEGELVKNVSAGACPLTVESMKSIISALKDYSTEAPFTYTVTFSSTCLSALDAEGNTAPNGKTWRDYISDLGWNLG